MNPLRQRCLDHYGAVCDLCGEDDVEILCFDHRNGHGSEHRRYLKRRNIRMHQWIIEEGFPESIRLLCWNCNMKDRVNRAKAYHEKAGHKTNTPVDREKKVKTPIEKKQFSQRIPVVACEYIERYAAAASVSVAEALTRIIADHRRGWLEAKPAETTVVVEAKPADVTPPVHDFSHLRPELREGPTPQPVIARARAKRRHWVLRWLLWIP